jgi:hypothetical protein
MLDQNNNKQKKAVYRTVAFRLNDKGTRVTNTNMLSCSDYGRLNDKGTQVTNTNMLSCSDYGRPGKCEPGKGDGFISGVT